MPSPHPPYHCPESGSRRPAICRTTEELQLPVFEGCSNLPLLAWPPSRLLDLALSALVPLDRRYSVKYWWVKEEKAQAMRERPEHETAGHEAEALEN